MNCFEVQINVITEGKSDYKATLTGYVPDNIMKNEKQRLRPAVLILPGGGYEYTSDREAEPIALEFLRKGVCAFILRYSIAPARFPQALCEALKSIAYIREHANDWDIDTNNIAVCGFSAGGHLCASVGVFWNNSILDAYINKNRDFVKPNMLILSYPVITSGVYAHRESFDALLGQNQTNEALEMVSLEKQVTKDVPPTFIWHTYEDGCVPVQNTMLFVNELIAKDIPTEVHIYRRGGHGLSLGNYLVDVQREFGGEHMSSEWIRHAIRFIFDNKELI
ncbi:alpha/beta hydrolase [Cellulosilyticum ruminicola]